MQGLWNTRDPEQCVKAYSEDSVWRNRDKFFTGHAAIKAFLTEKWQKEKQYRLRKELFSFTENKIAVEFWYEFVDDQGQWHRCYGIEHWTFDEQTGLMKKRHMSGNDVPIQEFERWFRDGVDVDSVELPSDQAA